MKYGLQKDNLTIPLKQESARLFKQELKTERIQYQMDLDKEKQRIKDEYLKRKAIDDEYFRLLELREELMAKRSGNRSLSLLRDRLASINALKNRLAASQKLTAKVNKINNKPKPKKRIKKKRLLNQTMPLAEETLPEVPAPLPAPEEVKKEEPEPPKYFDFKRRKEAEYIPTSGAPNITGQGSKIGNFNQPKPKSLDVTPARSRILTHKLDFKKAAKSRLLPAFDPNAPPRQILRNAPIQITDERVLKMMNYGKFVKREFVPAIDSSLELQSILNKSFVPEVYDSSTVRVPIEQIIRNDERLRKSDNFASGTIGKRSDTFIAGKKSDTFLTRRSNEVIRKRPTEEIFRKRANK